MTRFARIVSRSALTSFLVFGVISLAALASDLSKYRNFQLGTDLPTIAKQVGASPTQTKTIHRRPALIQELEWRPQAIGLSLQAESVHDVVFSFYDGELFRIAITYDQYEIEGMTAEDLIEAISATYGTAEKPIHSAVATQGQYGDQEDIVAQWQDSDYSFNLIRFSYGRSFRLVGALKRLQAPARAAIAEAKRLDDQEAPQRDAARIADEKETERSKLEKARLLNKPKFRP
jgi:hypothetical protein